MQYSHEQQLQCCFDCEGQIQFRVVRLQDLQHDSCTLTMTITSARYIEPSLASDGNNGKKTPIPVSRIWHAVDPPFKGYQPAPSEAHQQGPADTVIVIDNGTHTSHCQLCDYSDADTRLKSAARRMVFRQDTPGIVPSRCCQISRSKIE